jgi:hypothetical protein
MTTHSTLHERNSAHEPSRTPSTRRCAAPLVCAVLNSQARCPCSPTQTSTPVPQPCADVPARHERSLPSEHSGASMSKRTISIAHNRSNVNSLPTDSRDARSPISSSPQSPRPPRSPSCTTTRTSTTYRPSPVNQPSGSSSVDRSTDEELTSRSHRTDCRPIVVAAEVDRHSAVVVVQHGDEFQAGAERFEVLTQHRHAHVVGWCRWCSRRVRARDDSGRVGQPGSYLADEVGQDDLEPVEQFANGHWRAGAPASDVGQRDVGQRWVALGSPAPARRS